MTMKPESKPPPKSVEQCAVETDAAKKALEEACVAVEVASKKADKVAAKAKRTISDSKMQAVRLPTASQMDLEERK